MSRANVSKAALNNEHSRLVYISTALEYCSPRAPKTLREVGYRALYRNASLRVNRKPDALALSPSDVEFCEKLCESKHQQDCLIERIEELKMKHAEDKERLTGWYNSLVSQIRVLEDYIDKLEDEKFELSNRVEVTTKTAEMEKAEAEKRLAEATHRLSIESQAKYNVEICLRQAETDIKTSTNSAQVTQLENTKTSDEVSRLSDALSASESEIEELKKALAKEKKDIEELRSKLFATTQENSELFRQLSEKEDRLVGLEMERDMGRGILSIPRTPRSGNKSRSMGFFGFHRSGDSPRKRNPTGGASQ